MLIYYWRSQNVTSNPYLFLLPRKEPQHLTDHLVIGAQLAFQRSIRRQQGIVDLDQQLVAAVARPGLVISGPAIGIFFDSIIVQRDGPPVSSFRAGHRQWMPMIRVGVGIEDDTAVEDRRYTLFTGLHF